MFLEHAAARKWSVFGKTLLAGTAMCILMEAPAVSAGKVKRQPVVTLTPTLVTATRTDLAVKETPLAVQVITRDEIERQESKNLYDALKNAPGIDMHTDFQGRSNISIRGSESRHVLILINGRRLSGELSYNSANAQDINRIRMDNVERIEIIRGPAGALYGSDAIGGVINVITRDVTSNEGSIRYDYTFFNNGNGAGYNTDVYYQGVARNFFYSLSAGINQTQPYRDDDDNDWGWHGKEAPIAARLGWKFDNGNKLTLDYSKLFERTKWRYTDGMMTKYNKLSENHNDRTDYSITYEGKTPENSWMLRAYQSIYDKRYDITKHYSTGKTVAEMADTVTRKISVLEGQLSWSSGSKHYLTSGFEWRKDDSDGTRIKKPSTPVGPNPKRIADEANIKYFAVYLQDEFRPAEKWLIVPSLRFDWSSEFASRITMGLAATYMPKDDFRIKAAVEQGYKTPTVNELYHFWEMYPSRKGMYAGQFWEGNPNLGPEKSTSYEFSIEKDFGNWTTIHLGVFRNEVDDLIDVYWTGRNTSQNPGAYPGFNNDDIWTYRNLPKAVMQGLEATVSHRLTENLHLNFAYTYLDAQDGDHQRLYERARHALNIGLAWQPADFYAWNASVTLRTTLGYHIRKNHEDLDFTLIDVMAQKNIAADAKLYLGVDNVGNYDNADIDRMYYHGRTFRAGLEYRF